MCWFSCSFDIVFLFLLIVFYSSSLFKFHIATIVCTEYCVVLLMSCTFFISNSYFYSFEHKMLSSSWSVIVFIFIIATMCTQGLMCCCSQPANTGLPLDISQTCPPLYLHTSKSSYFSTCTMYLHTRKFNMTKCMVI